MKFKFNYLFFKSVVPTYIPKKFNFNLINKIKSFNLHNSLEDDEYEPLTKKGNIKYATHPLSGGSFSLSTQNNG